jgi:hypothetical protein
VASVSQYLSPFTHTVYLYIVLTHIYITIYLYIIIYYHSHGVRARLWVPGVSSPGRPNDYINLFLEETKQWMRSQMTLDAVHAQELSRRDMYYTKLKNDNYFWCFPRDPQESEDTSIQKVIDFVHDRVKNALELISREEKNRSLQSFFKELNDHTTNAFEFGKQFLAYLMFATTKVNGSLTSNRIFDGRTYETGKLHGMLEAATNIVLESYVQVLKPTKYVLKPTPFMLCHTTMY